MIMCKVNNEKYNYETSYQNTGAGDSINVFC